MAIITKDQTWEITDGCLMSNAQASPLLCAVIHDLFKSQIYFKGMSKL